eukprot:8636964-Lingulodinium_polyedra.AAC.1
MKELSRKWFIYDSLRQDPSIGNALRRLKRSEGCKVNWCAIRRGRRARTRCALKGAYPVSDRSGSLTG